MHVVLPHARALADELAAELIRTGARAAVVGEVRAGIELVSELSLVCDRAPSEVIATLRAPDLALTSADGGVVGTLTLDHAAVPVRVRCTSPRGFIDAVLRLSSSPAHLEALEDTARSRCTTVASVAHEATDEDAVYIALGLPVVPAELRDTAALVAPELVERVRGVFHVHTTWSDGIASVAVMARAARDRGFSYLGISDHSRAAHYANGLDVERLMQQRLDVERARVEVPDITIFHGLECDILADGTLDLPDRVLAKLDFVVASVHSELDLSRDEQTRRVVRAVEHPLVTILGHPTGRLLLGRPGIDIDVEAIARSAAARGVALEINTTGQRLDLCADHARLAADLGASFAISPDAHEPRGFDMIPFGVILARRARLGDDRVMNTRDASEMTEFLAARRARANKQLGLA